MAEKNDKKKFDILYGIDDRYVSIILVAVFLLLLVPIIYLGKYNFMKADDYSYGAYAHRAFVETGSFFEAFKGALQSVKTNYYAWQGTFSSIFLMSFAPYIFNYRFYKLVPLFMTFMITFSSFFLSFTLIKKVLKQDKISLTIIVGTLLSLLMIERLYTVPGALYWYNASVHYIFAECIFFILSALFIHICITPKTSMAVILSAICMLLSVEVGGSNYSTILTGLVTLISLTILVFILKKERTFLLFPSIFVYSVSFVINVTAPGNNARGAYYEGMDPVMSILNSFKSTFLFSLEWFDVYTIAVMLILIPVFVKCVSKTGFKFRFPLLVFIFSICLISTGFTSSYYALGNSGLSRTINVVKMTWQILLLFNEAYLIGWIKKNIIKDKKEQKERNIPLIVLIGSLLVILLQPALLKPLGTIPSYTAFEYFAYGHAQAYWVESMERLAILEVDTKKDVILNEYTSTPFYLYLSDVTEDASYWENKAVADYYGKNSVVLKPREK